MNSTDLLDTLGLFNLSTAGYYSIGFTILILGTFGVVANIISIVMFMKNTTSRTSADALLCNLAFADLAKSGVCFPFLVISNFAESWIFGDLGCTFYGFLSFLLGNASITTLGAISVERFLIICKGYPAALLMRRVHVIKVLTFIWMQALIWAMLPIILGVDYTLEPFQTSCTVNWRGSKLEDKLFTLGLVTIVFGGNLMIMAYCYYNIYITTNKIPCQERNVDDVELTKVCCLLIISFVSCWLPYVVVSMIGAYGNPDIISPTGSVIPAILAKFSACVNPIMYILMSRKFRKRYLTTVRCRKMNRLYPSRILTVEVVPINNNTNDLVWRHLTNTWC